MPQWYLAILPVIFVIMNVAGFLLMLSDKRRAERGARRIPEAVLFIVAFLFGGLGSTIAMFAFRHKTQHWYFVVFFPVFAVIGIAALIAGEICFIFADVIVKVVQSIANNVSAGA